MRQKVRVPLLVGAVVAMLGPAFSVWAANPGVGTLGQPSPASESARDDSPVVLDGQSPLPGPIIVSQIHNAPGWQPSHSYAYAPGPYTRVVSGPGWDPAGPRYVPGQALAAYQLTSHGRCLSAAGQGPRGAGQAIKDGTCTWKYLSRVDYISITGWAFDNRPWEKGVYHFLNYVTSDNPLRAYELQDQRCDSTEAPTGTGGKTGKVVTGDGCHWQYQASIIYTSGRSYIPTESFEHSNGPATVLMRGNYEAQLWNDREYVAGEHGEAIPIRVQSHDDYRHEGGVLLGCAKPHCYHIIITAAPGESFANHLTATDPLSGYDPRNGVAIRNTHPYQWPYEPAGIDVHDNFVDIVGLQIKSTHGAAINGLTSFGNNLTIRDSILEGGSLDAWTSHTAVNTDTSSVIANCLVISHTVSGIVLKYPGFVVNSTIVNPDHIPGSVGIEIYNKWVFPNSTVANTAIFGFTHAVAHLQPGTSWSPRSSHNMTDAAPNDSGTEPWPYGDSLKVTIDPLPGTVYGVSMAGAFVHPGSDWRPAGNSPLRGAGRPFGPIAVNCVEQHPACPQRTVYDFDRHDIVGTARPPSGGYDIGAAQATVAVQASTAPQNRPARP